MGKGGGLGGVTQAIGGGVIGGAVNQFIGGQQADQANKRMALAAQNAALSQQAEAQRQYNLNTQTLNEAESRLGGYTVSALANADRDIAAQERNLSRQERLISQIDPTIIEASQQALKLLRGEQSSTLAPLQRQRDQQRQKLLNNLRAQLGPGAETSTAGMQALNRFDAETDSLFAGAQQSALSALGGLSGQFSAQRPDMLREIQGSSGLNQARYGYGANLANFATSKVNALQGAGSALLGTQGAQYTSDLLRGQYQQGVGQRQQEQGAQQQQQAINTITGVFGGGLGGMMGGGGGGALKMGAQAGGSYFPGGSVA